MRIPDEVIDYVADKYRELGLHKTNLTFFQYLTAWLKDNNYEEVA